TFAGEERRRHVVPGPGTIGDDDRGRRPGIRRPPSGSRPKLRHYRDARARPEHPWPSPYRVVARPASWGQIRDAGRGAPPVPEEGGVMSAKIRVLICDDH